MPKKRTEEFISEKNITLVRDLKSVDAICAEQIKAARALLGWSQADLAQKSGYSLPAINNIERGLSVARVETLSIIEQTFEQAGVQFIDGPGVRMENSFFRIKVLEGVSAVAQLLRNILYVLEKDGGELLWCGVNEKQLIWAYKEDVLAFQSKVAQNKKVTVKTMCYPDQDMGLTFVGGEKRLVNPAKIPLLPTLLYKDRIAFIMMENPVRITIMSHEATTETMKKQFQTIWDSL